MSDEQENMPPQRVEANARLIAAAPELLTALTDLLHEAYSVNDEGNEVIKWAAIDAASAAVKRAIVGKLERSES